MISLFRKSQSLIRTQADMEEAVLRYGILPFFKWEVPGMSIQEMASPGYLFNDEEGGCWEWKGPIIRSRRCAYGKLFLKKAGFVSLDLLPDFLNVRRSNYILKPESTEEMLLEIIRLNGSMTSTELNTIVNGMPSRRRGPTDLKDSDTCQPAHKSKRISLEGPLQRLQMAGRLLISDFKYKKTRTGANYGWGIAEYATPEEIFGSDILFCSRSPEESFSYLMEECTKRWGQNKHDAIKLLILSQ